MRRRRPGKHFIHVRRVGKPDTVRAIGMHQVKLKVALPVALVNDLVRIRLEFFEHLLGRRGRPIGGACSRAQEHEGTRCKKSKRHGTLPAEER